MIDFMIVVILVLIIGSVIFYLVKAKKRGETCIGCPYAKQCGGNCNGNSKEENKACLDDVK